MPTFSPHRFTNSAFLKKIAPANLISFLTSTEAIKTYFANRGFVPPTEGAGGIDYDALIGILADPDTGMPKELVDGLYFVHEMSTPEIMEELMEEAGVLVTCEPGVDPTPADVAIQIWLKDRDLLERKHSEQFLIRPKSFVYYQGAQDEPREAPVLSDFARADMEGEMDEWFERKRRGKGTRVFCAPARRGSLVPGAAWRTDPPRGRPRGWKIIERLLPPGEVRRRHLQLRIGRAGR